MTLRIFIGMDRRQPVAYNVLQQSIIRNAENPHYSITPLVYPQLEKICPRRGLTDFTYTRFLVPYLCNYEGVALFMDADMLVRANIVELRKFAGQVSDDCAVKVVQSIERFEWPSLMLFNNWACKTLTPEFIQNENPYKLKWGSVGELPSEWNHVVGYSPRRSDAKIVHFTMGIPIWEETKDCEYADEWKKEFQLMNSSVSFTELMGQSRHDVARLRA